MKHFMWFALCAVATIVLIHVISRLLGLGKPDQVVWYVPIAFLYFGFYGFGNPFAKSKSEENED
jgi:hypothetical protein